MGIVRTGVAVRVMPPEKYTDGSYRRPRTSDNPVYVKWDDGTRGWVGNEYVRRE